MKCLAQAAFIVSISVLSASALAAQDHSSLVNGPFKSGAEVTKACLQCHEQQARDFMKTQHWTWSVNQEIPGRGKFDLGKKTAINNY